jgi:hypothetical protein
MAKRVCRTSHPKTTAVQDMGIPHHRRYITVAQQLLNGPDVIPRFQQVRGERMPEGVATGTLRDSRSAHRLDNGAPHDGGMKMMTTPDSRVRVPMVSRRRKHSLPRPARRRQHVGFAESAGMSAVVIADKSYDPMQVGRLRSL